MFACPFCLCIWHGYREKTFKLRQINLWSPGGYVDGLTCQSFQHIAISTNKECPKKMFWYLDASSDLVSSHKLPCIALDTFTQCNGFSGVLLDGWLARKLLGLLDRTVLRPFAPNDNVGGGGGAELGTFPLLGKEFEKFLGGGPGGGGGSRVIDGFFEAVLSPVSFGGGNGGTGGADT